MNTKHVPSLELCQEFDTLCKEKGIVVPETEYCWMPVTMPPIDGVEYILAKVGKDCPTNYRYGFPAPLVSEQGEWLKDYMEDKENDGEAVPDDMPKADRMGLLWEPNFMQKMINYLIAEGIITTL